MSPLLNFVIAFAFSFVGSIPPGVLNLTVIQLGMEHKMKIAYRFAFAAALIEYPYAWLAIAFEKYLSSQTGSNSILQVIAASVLLIVGTINLRVSNKKNDKPPSAAGSGFRRGVILSIINPMALPFWLAGTTYLKSLGLISLSSQLQIHSYLVGVSAGAFILLMSAAHLAKYSAQFFQQHPLVKKFPALIMIALGCYGVAAYFL
jgi:threonine/homoserine/homoserine lactone efflux protein